MPVVNRIAAFHDEMRAWRHRFHAHPELEFDVQRTAKSVAALLHQFGCDQVVSGIGRSGVVGVIHGAGSTSRRVIGIRADMDALPIGEQTGLPYASKEPGKTHACGHDGHMAMVLGAAKYLAETRAFNGSVAVIFQPAEELGGGADVMVKDGLMERFTIDEVYALHNMPGLAANSVAARHGTLFAASDNFEILLKGRGGHAARPHETLDPVVCGAQIVSALQNVVSRNTDPLKSAVVSVTAVQCGDTFNVIPDQGRLLGTVRALDEEMRQLAESRLHSIVELVAKSAGLAAELTYMREYPPTINHPEQTEFAIETAIEIVGRPNVETDTAPLMGCEDFAYMLQARPGAYVLLGNGDSAPVHHPAYDFNDEVLVTGASYFARLVERALPT